MAHEIAKGWFCGACEKIATQPFTHAGPHEFLVLRRPGASAIYQCLVCHSNLMCEAVESMPRWKALASPSTVQKNGTTLSASRPVAVNLDTRPGTTR